MWETLHIMSPLSEKVGGCVPRVPHLIAPMTPGDTAAILSEKKYMLQVRYELHLSDKARCYEASRFSITKIW